MCKSRAVVIGDDYAFTARKIGSFKTGKTKPPLTKTGAPDDSPICPTGNTRVREVA